MSGLFGVASKNNCWELLFLGTDYHSHMGTEYGGLAVYDSEEVIKKIHKISNSQFKSKFYEEKEELKGKYGIGVISAGQTQPLVFGSKFGEFAICLNGRLENRDELAKELQQKGCVFSEVRRGIFNTTEVIANLINQGNDIIDGITKMFDKIQGSISLLLLNKDGVYAARDKNGVTPLVVAKDGDTWAVATETCAFPNLGLKIEKYVAPGEIVLLTENGMQEKKKNGKKNKICAFLWIYTGFPTSSYEGINAEIVRENCGKNLAKDDNVKADYVTGIPDSGVGHAIGYAIGSKLPYRRPLVKYNPGYGRSYTPPSQEIRDRIAKMKLLPNEDIIKGKSIIFCDDSIVRGTQFKNFTITKLKQCKVKEIHLRIACPPLMFPCKFNLSTRTHGELAARRAIKALEGKDIEDVSEYLDSKTEKYKKMVEWIRDDLGVESLKYHNIDDMVKAIGLPKDNMCLYCWLGKF